MPRPLRIRDVEVDGRRQLEVVVRGGLVASVSPMGAVEAPGDEQVLDGSGGALLPGLHDHHIHLFALAARSSSLWVGPPEVTNGTSMADVLRAHDRAARGRDWIRGVGWDDTTAGWLDRRALDQAVPDRPVRVQHRSGALWVLNSAGLARIELEGGSHGLEGVELGPDGLPTGRLFGLDHWLGTKVGPGPPDLAAVSTDLARCGITGVTDATAHNGPEELEALEQARRSGALRQRLVAMTREGVDADGPVKLVLADHALPPFDDLVGSIVRAHGDGRTVAIHAASRTTVVLAVAALAEARARPADRIEHASVIDPDTLARLARLGSTVVTQHHFLAESGDRYLATVDAEEQPWLYRGRSFLDAGVPLAAGSDAPVGGVDPWAAMRAATGRTSASGRRVGPAEALTPDEALALHLGPADRPGHGPRQIRVGEPADLCLLGRPWREVRGNPTRADVAATVIAGAVVHP